MKKKHYGTMLLFQLTADAVVKQNNKLTVNIIKHRCVNGEGM